MKTSRIIIRVILCLLVAALLGIILFALIKYFPSASAAEYDIMPLSILDDTPYTLNDIQGYDEPLRRIDITPTVTSGGINYHFPTGTNYDINAFGVINNATGWTFGQKASFGQTYIGVIDIYIGVAKGVPAGADLKEFTYFKLGSLAWGDPYVYYVSGLSTYWSDVELDYRITFAYFIAGNAVTEMLGDYYSDTSYLSRLATETIGIYDQYELDLNARYWYELGKSDGYDEGYENGYDTGYIDGTGGGGVGTTLDAASTLIRKIWAIVDVPILGPYFTVGTLLAISVILGLVFLILRFIRG